MKNILFYISTFFPILVFSQQTGSLDASFGDHGLSIVDHQSFETLSAMAVQPDGKIVAVGFSGGNNFSQIAVLRYDPDGALDENFGVDGIYTGQLQTTLNSATAVALQPDGKILVAGYYMSDQSSSFREDMFLLRLDSNGVPDSTFNDDGFQTFDLGKNERAVGISIGPDGKIYVAGNSFIGNMSNMLVFRYEMNGTPDTSFGSGGYVILANSVSSWNYIYDMLIQPDGKVLIAGESGSSFSGSNFTLMRVNPNGTFDTSFNGDGKTTNSLGTKDDVPLALSLLADGKILLGGYSVGTDNKTNIALVQYTANGYFDNAFGVLGKVITPAEDGYGAISDLCITAEGDILAVGTAKTRCTYFDLVLVKYDQFGALQTDFGEQGFLFTDLGQHADGIGAAQLLPDGKLIAVGAGVDMSNSISEFLVARYALDANVGTDNIVNLETSARVFPNPVTSGQLTLQFALWEESDVDVELFSLGGQQLGSMLHLASAIGPQKETIDLPAGLPTGCYLAGIRTKFERAFVKIIIQ